MASLPYPRSHKTIFPQNARNTQKRLAEKKNLCTSVKSAGGSSPPEASVYSVNSVGEYPPPEASVNSVNSVGEYPPPEISVNSVNSVGGYSPPEASVNSVKSVGEYPPPEASVNSVNSVGGLAQTNLEWVLWKEFGGLRGYGRDAIPTQPQNYLPTEFTEHTETTGGEEKSVSICEICGRLLPARRFCGFCVFRGRFLSEAMLVQRRPLHPLKIAMLQQQGCHATTTRLPCYNNNIATLQQQDCHATTTRLPRYNNKIATLRQQGCHATAKCRETDVRQTGR